MVEKLFPDSFLKNKSLVYLSNSLKALYSFFLLYGNLRAIEM